jgi:hypothetical protein
MTVDYSGRYRQYRDRPMQLPAIADIFRLSRRMRLARAYMRR